MFIENNNKITIIKLQYNNKIMIIKLQYNGYNKMTVKNV
jgi:hypothetical protein